MRSATLQLPITTPRTVSGILEVLTQNILPIFLVAGVGFWLRRGLQVDTKPVASVVFNAFSPALVFSALVNSELGVAELGQLALFTLLSITIMGIVGFLAARLLRLSKVESVVLLLTIMFVNGGNYGLTLNQLRYGEAGLALAVVYYMTSTVLAYTVGVFIASVGNRSWKDSLRKLASVPAIYAVVVALAIYGLNLTVPAPMMSAIDLVAAGAIPAMLLVLGMNMSDLRTVSQMRLTLPAVGLRLLVGPLAALLVAALLGLQGLARSVSIIEASMPTAVLTTVLATEFDVQPGAVTGIVVLSTLLSPITLSLLIEILAL